MSFCRLTAIVENYVAAVLVSAAPREVLSAAVATPLMLLAISVLPLAASVTLRLISPVVAVCYSTALAIVPW